MKPDTFGLVGIVLWALGLFTLTLINYAILAPIAMAAVGLFMIAVMLILKSNEITDSLLLKLKTDIDAQQLIISKLYANRYQRRH